VLDSTDFRVVASENNVQDVELASFADHRFLLFIIVSCHDIGSALEQIERFKTDYPAGRVALLADDSHLEEAISAFRVGANACFTNVHTCHAFIKALEMVMLGETIVPPELLTLVSKGTQEPPADSAGARSTVDHASANEADAAPRLSEREKNILRYIVEGSSNKHIARKLSIAEATVKVHVRAILGKLRVKNRTQAAIWAMSKRSDLWALEDDMALPLASKGPVTKTAIDWSSIPNKPKVDVNGRRVAR
jgi:two-component system nitrate/nitrite response regulator NarL